MIVSVLHRAAITVQHPSGDPRQDHATPKLLVCELPLSVLGYDAVLGRDILDGLRFTYDGPARTFTLDY